MNRTDRAKQFMPFDALKGLHEELKRRESKFLRTEKIEICEEKNEQISDQIKRLKKGANARCTYYKNGYYLYLVGEVKKVDFSLKFLLLEEEKIFFEDVYELVVE